MKMAQILSSRPLGKPRFNNHCKNGLLRFLPDFLMKLSERYPRNTKFLYALKKAVSVAVQSYSFHITSDLDLID